MKTEKIVWHLFDPSAFDEELGLLNAMSEKGWQLADMCAFTQKYVWDDGTVYRYAIDLQESLSVSEFTQYRVEFEEQGWAYVTKHGSWYVFRRPYDTALPEESYLLYTDEPSFRDMKRGVGPGLSLFGLIWLPAVISRLSLYTILPMVVWLLHIVDYAFRRRRLRRVRRVPKPYRFHTWRYSNILILLLLLSCFAAVQRAIHTDVFLTEGQTVGVQSGSFTMRAPDLVTLRLWTASPKDGTIPAESPVFTLRDENGRLVDSGLLDRDDSTTEFLSAGTYTLTVDWDAASVPGAARNGGTDYFLQLGHVSFASTSVYIALLILDFLVFAAVIFVTLKRKL